MEWVVVFVVGVVVGYIWRGKSAGPPPQPSIPEGARVLVGAAANFFQDSVRSKICTLVLKKLLHNPKATVKDVADDVREFVNDELDFSLNETTAEDIARGMVCWYRHACSLNMENIAGAWKNEDDAMKEQIIKQFAKVTYEASIRHGMMPDGHKTMTTKALEAISWVYAKKYEAEEMTPERWNREVVEKLGQKASKSLAALTR